MDEESPAYDICDTPYLPTGGSNGALTVAALLRGNPQAALRHRLKELKGTEWGQIAGMISGLTNGSSVEKLVAACAGIRLAGMDADTSRRYLMAEISHFDGWVEDWLSHDEEFTRRRAIPRKTLEEVSGMFDDTEWIWDGWIPRGYVSMIVGRPGAGKSYVAAWLATNAMLRGQFPDGQHSELDREKAEIMWVDTEATHSLLSRRLRTMAAPQKRFYWPLDPKDTTEPFPVVDLSNPYWAGIVADMALSLRPEWMIIDSLRGAHLSDENSSDMQVILGTAAAIARDANCAITFIHHLRKQAPGESNEVTLDMVRGSSSIVAVARVVIAIDSPNPLASTEKRLRVIKSNLAEMPEPVGITIDERGPMLLDHAPDVPRRLTLVAKAAEFLRARLRMGPAPQTELVADAEAQGISLRTLRRAADNLDIVTVKKADGGYWEWSLPAREGQVPF